MGDGDAGGGGGKRYRRQTDGDETLVLTLVNQACNCSDMNDCTAITVHYKYSMTDAYVSAADILRGIL